MDIEQLKKLLESGAITQEQFETMSAIISNAVSEEDKKEVVEKEDTNSNDNLEKLIQRAVDRATNKLGNDKKKLQEQLEKMKKEKMSDDERKQYELDEKEQMIAEREKAIQDKENRLYAVKALKKAGLDDGGEDSLELIELVLGNDETEIDNRVKSFKALIDRKVKAEVDKTFKENGREPGKGSGMSDNIPNPYKKETFNFTKQCELERTNPELAKQLQSQAQTRI